MFIQQFKGVYFTYFDVERLLTFQRAYEVLCSIFVNFGLPRQPIWRIFTLSQIAASNYLSPSLATALERLSDCDVHVISFAAQRRQRTAYTPCLFATSVTR